MRLPAFVLSAALAAALLAGCGSTTSNNAGDFQGDKKSIAQVVDDLQKAAKGRPDTKEICNTIFAKAVAQKLQQGSDDCQDAVTRQLKDASDFDVSVKSITVNGTTATASVVSKVNGNDATQTLQFVKDGSAWRISGIGS